MGRRCWLAVRNMREGNATAKAHGRYKGRVPTVRRRQPRSSGKRSDHTESHHYSRYPANDVSLRQPPG
jgi:hypothetical protein